MPASALTVSSQRATRTSGLKVTALCPGPTRTEFFDVARNEDAAFGRLQTAGQVVATAFRALDRGRTLPSVICSTQNALQAHAVHRVPRRFLLGLVGRMGAPKR